MLKTPLLEWTKAQIVAAGHGLDVDYADTVSCYDPRTQNDAVLACGRCDSCQLRRQGFAQAGVPDPTRYITGPVAGP
jgi:7-cyano-7-deazaguanine synthase